LDGLVGTPKIIPIVDVIAGGQGNNSEFHIVGWGVITVTAYNFTGSASSKYVKVEKMYAYMGSLKPSNDLSDTDVIEGAFASAGLVE
jgi:hypothetical protein